MKQKKEMYRTTDTMQERSWSLLAEMWQEQEAEALLAGLEEEQHCQREMKAFFEQYDVQNLQLIQKVSQWNHFKRAAGRMALHAARVAAVFLVLVMIAGGVAVASNEMVRVQMMKLFVETKPEYISLRLAEDGDRYVEVPAGWQGTYYPTVIPEELVISDIFSVGTIDNSVIYTFPGSNVWQFVFDESTEGTTNVALEDAEVSSVTVCGYEGTMICKENRICIYWFDGRSLMMIQVRDHTEEEALMYANSVRRIR